MTTLALAPTVHATATETGMVLLDEQSGRYWQLNPSGAFILRALLDGAPTQRGRRPRQPVSRARPRAGPPRGHRPPRTPARYPAGDLVTMFSAPETPVPLTRRERTVALLAVTATRCLIGLAPGRLHRVLEALRGGTAQALAARQAIVGVNSTTSSAKCRRVTPRKAVWDRAERSRATVTSPDRATRR
ncbi:PqqD family peptide modification chaperone [Streptomyces sp. NPDC052507]|uniref:PqqD family peptide modification chaperone n=2 Tax=Streptomyces TaxID=1883 RepID=UPI0034357B8D